MVSGHFLSFSECQQAELKVLMEVKGVLIRSMGELRAGSISWALEPDAEYIH
jgi:hypothetical protein